MADPRKVLWTTDGPMDLEGGALRERVELQAGLLRWFEQFGDVAQHFAMGLHCAKCKSDFVAKNGASDRVWSLVCGCREFVGQNPNRRPDATRLPM